MVFPTSSKRARRELRSQGKLPTGRVAAIGAMVVAVVVLAWTPRDARVDAQRLCGQSVGLRAVKMISRCGRRLYRCFCKK